MKKTGNAVCVLYILAALTGIGYFWTAYRAHTLVFWSYMEDITLSGGLLPRIINYAKDIYVVFFALWLFLKQNRGWKMKKAWFYLCFFMVLGIVLALLSNNGMRCVIGGIRAYLFAFVVYCYCWQDGLDENFWKKFLKIVKCMVLLQLVGVFIQAGLSGEKISLGSGAYRMMGLFTNAGTLGFFSLGAAVCISYAFLNKKVSQASFYIFAIILLFLGLSSGSRGCVLYISTIIVVSVIEKSRLNKNSKAVALPLIVAAILIGLVLLLTMYVGRGNIMISGAGRFGAWTDLCQLELWQLLIGTGLGAGTNSARSLGATSIEMDSSFTVFIVQYGIWGFVLFVTKMVRVFADLYRNSQYRWYALTLMGITFVVLFSASLMEQYVLIIPLIIVFSSICNDDVVNTDKKNKHRKNERRESTVSQIRRIFM